MLVQTEQDVGRARALVLRYGWNATAFQLVNPGIVHWFAPDGDAVVGYVTRAGVRVIAGAPVCAEERLPEVIDAFEGEARAAGERVCYLGAAGRVMSVLSEREGYAFVVLGAQPVWEPSRWAETMQGRASVRAQLARARNKGVTVREWPAEEATDHPALWRCLGEWLESRTLPTLHFLDEPETLTRLEGRRIFVAERNGEPVGFVNCSPIPTRNGWLIEQFVRGSDAPNGTVELMLDGAMRTLAADGAEYVTLGLVPLSRNTWVPADYNPLWLRWTLAWVRAHGNRFYNFEGLERFKSKFQPHGWEPIHAIYNRPRFSIRSLWAIGAAFTHRNPLVAFGSGLVKAVRQEVRWWRERHPTSPETSRGTEKTIAR